MNKPFSLHHVAPFFSLLAVSAAVGCGPVDAGEGDTSNDTTSSTSGMSSTGGMNGTGGTSGTGGMSGTGSTSGTGGMSGTGGAGGGSAGSPKRVIGYFTAWGIYERNYQVSDIPASKLTHINYAFANIANGECALGDSWADVEKPMGDDKWDTPLRGNFHQLQLLKKAHPGLKTLISVGGWTWSANFSAAASTEASRAKLASSCVKFMKDYGFDGIDIDWEYPVSGGLSGGVPADKENYTLLLAELRKQMDAQGTADGGVQYQLSTAVPAGSTVIANLELNKIHTYLDFINVMAYDFHGAWENTTNHNAPLHAVAADPSPTKATFYVDSAIKAYLAGGVPADKVVMGMPFYGRGWSGVPSAGQGLYQPATGAAPSKWEAGIFDYKELDALPGFTRYWSDEAQVPWMYNAQTQVMISYDDAKSLGIKADYVNKMGLGGAMIWDLSGDDAQGSLLNALAVPMGL